MIDSCMHIMALEAFAGNRLNDDCILALIEVQATAEIPFPLV